MIARLGREGMVLMSDTLARLCSLMEDFVPDKGLIRPDVALIGEGRILDSMTLVELCLALEDMAADEGFDFDWTSEHAMSRSRSIFRSVQALADEYASQKAKAGVRA